MDPFDVYILGCGSATPSAYHYPSCQIIDHRGRLMMIDCGEGAQVNMRRSSLKFNRLTDIFISHLHGDHCFGLPGLLSTFALHQRTGAITIHTSPEGKRILEPFISYFTQGSPFEIRFRTFDPYGRHVIVDDRSLTVSTFPLYHRIATTGFLFREKPRQRTYLPEAGRRYGVSHAQIPLIKSGLDLTLPDGTVVPNSELTLPPPPPRSYAYCSDTMYHTRLARDVEGVDMLYHEATYTSDLADQAYARGHSTARQAATTALNAGVGTLLIGHYSKRYPSPEPLLDEAREVFPNTIAANELLTVPVRPY